MSKALGEAIRQRREARRITQAELARKLDAQTTAISRLEHGGRDLLVTELWAVAQELDIRPSSLISGTEKKLE